MEDVVRDLSFLDTFSGRRVLVTGHTGFKGSWLSAWLVRLGAEVTGFSDMLPSDPCHFAILRPAVEDRRGDLCDHKALSSVLAEARPEIVFHLAAQPLVRVSYDDPIGTYQTNVIGTLTLFEVVRAVGGVSAIVSATTDKVYRNHEWPWGYREGDELGGSDPYSASKSCVELMTRSYCESFFRESGPAIASVRAGNVIGGGDWAADRLIPDIVRAVFSRQTLSIRNPASTRPWQHVLDPLCGYLQIGARLLSGEAPRWEAWNFGPEKIASISVRQIVDEMKATVPQLDASFGSSDAARKESNLLELDSSKAIKTLDWRPVWEGEMLERTFAWYKAWYEEGRILTGEQIDAYRQALAA